MRHPDLLHIEYRIKQDDEFAHLEEQFVKMCLPEWPTPQTAESVAMMCRQFLVSAGVELDAAGSIKRPEDAQRVHPRVVEMLAEAQRLRFVAEEKAARAWVETVSIEGVSAEILLQNLKDGFPNRGDRVADIIRQRFAASGRVSD